MESSNQGIHGQMDQRTSSVHNVPFLPNTSFTQEIIFSTEEGTLWWHAHSDWSRATVHGAIIILPTPGTTLIREWYKGDVMAIIDEAFATGDDPNLSDAFTINGQPGDLYECSNDATAQYDNTTTTAILQYKGKYTPPSSIPFPTLPSYNDTEVARNFTKRLRSLASKDHPVKVPQSITKRIFITVSVNQLYCPNASCSGPNGNRLSASLNNISFVTPDIDVLQAYYRNLPKVYANNFPNQPPYYFNFTGDVGNDTVYPSTGTKGSGNFNNKTDPKSYNLIDPPEVNTFGVPKNGWLAIRFIADNPGVWFLHCHLERHASWGMNTVLIVKNGGTSATSIRPPPKYMPPCFQVLVLINV
uniref:Plastocyanin-like domain-containing protein n=1 Tax=Fagus sylvatica TaxID=28930 RepID=A0A2N9H4X4_FAGSY